jgi:outer membrane lipoprotein carrier protein
MTPAVGAGRERLPREPEQDDGHRSYRKRHGFTDGNSGTTIARSTDLIVCLYNAAGLNRNRRAGVNHSVSRFAAIFLTAIPLFAQDAALKELLNEVEAHYNGVRTLQVNFEESLSTPGHPRRTEAGRLYLRKPGRMRWDYTLPAGKLFMSDGKQVYYYNPTTNTAEKMKLKETEDLRAPLAFLLGRLDFEKDFTNFTARTEGEFTVITATPKSDKLPYKQVEFAVSPQREIRRLVVTGQDNALLSFVFKDERMNPVVGDQVFRFELPAGAKWIGSQETEAAVH